MINELRKLGEVIKIQYDIAQSKQEPIDQSKQELIYSLKNMLQVSKRININMLKEVVGVDSSIFYPNIFNLAAKLGLTVDGDYLDVDKVSVLDFIKVLDDYLKLGISNEMLIDEKLTCKYCGSSVKQDMKFCQNCGTNL